MRCQDQRLAGLPTSEDIVVRRPLVPLQFCMVMLDRDEDDLITDIEAGRIEWAFDLRRESSRRRLIRVWTSAIRISGSASPAVGMTLREVAEACLPQGRIRATDLCRSWTCSSTQISALIADGDFGAVKRPPVSSGPRSSPEISRKAALAFLMSRRVL